MAILGIPPATDITSLIEHYTGIRVASKARVAVKINGKKQGEPTLENHSNCPWCGGRDKFITRPDKGTYTCQTRPTCCGRWGERTQFLREYCGMTLQDACDLLGIDPSEVEEYTQVSAPSVPYGPSNDTWQARGELMVAKAQAMLYSPEGKKALDYLRARGLTDETIKEGRLGYVPCGPKGWYSASLEEWGLTSYGTGKEKVWQWEGILIPWYVSGKLWKLDIRRLDTRNITESNLDGLKKDPNTRHVLSIAGSVDYLYCYLNLVQISDEGAQGPQELAEAGVVSLP